MSPWIHFQAVYKAEVSSRQTFIQIIDVGLHEATQKGFWTAGGANSHQAAETVSRQRSTFSSLSLDRSPWALGYSASPCRGSLLPASFTVSVPPVSPTPPLMSFLNSVLVESTLSPQLCETGHRGNTTKPVFTHDLHCRWFHGLCILQVEGGNVTMTTAPGTAGMQNTYLKSSLTHVANGLH